jgi:hypothetical protein
MQQFVTPNSLRQHYWVNLSLTYNLSDSRKIFNGRFGFVKQDGTKSDTSKSEHSHAASLKIRTGGRVSKQWITRGLAELSLAITH